ncbi:DUF1611 domain-containing protein [Spirulina subsalsa FACHB-351]|uniref:DUF1611 domain-containing protein n=1 Tax=Spirulina subsalsa FACHB-351 TaxID=234711 RepID=A0ABT3KZN7_9CYAN|nr:DUF1611 domain-containing protein [Spirulina subsalsa]MCW6034716.1 DUF1611 domain-containing protein [Spirulina subsalsa FACHB-351]
MQLTTKHRVAVLLHQGIHDGTGKTGLSFIRYGMAPVVAVIDADCAGESLATVTGIEQDIPIVASVAEALTYEPDVLLIGLAPSGGILPDDWWQEVKQGVLAGLSVVNGLHTPMAQLVEELPSQTLAQGQWIWDIRQEPEGLGIGGGRARALTCQRILTVGTDMAVGKMSTSLELWKAAQRKGIRTGFVATGQAGLMIAGTGIPLDAIRVDFAAGAVEQALLAVGRDCDLVFIEGQGSLLHPGSTATLPLIRGSQPTGLILVHRAGQKTINRCPEVSIPPLPEVVRLYEMVGRAGGAFGETPVRGIALNTFHWGEQAAKEAIAQVTAETGLPCTDVVRFGADILLEATH